MLIGWQFTPGNRCELRRQRPVLTSRPAHAQTPEWTTHRTATELVLGANGCVLKVSASLGCINSARGPQPSKVQEAEQQLQDFSSEEKWHNCAAYADCVVIKNLRTAPTAAQPPAEADMLEAWKLPLGNLASTKSRTPTDVIAIAWRLQRDVPSAVKASVARSSVHSSDRPIRPENVAQGVATPTLGTLKQRRAKKKTGVSCAAVVSFLSACFLPSRGRRKRPAAAKRVITKRSSLKRAQCHSRAFVSSSNACCIASIVNQSLWRLHYSGTWKPLVAFPRT